MDMNSSSDISQNRTVEKASKEKKKSVNLKSHSNTQSLKGKPYLLFILTSLQINQQRNKLFNKKCQSSCFNFSKYNGVWRPAGLPTTPWMPFTQLMSQLLGCKVAFSLVPLMGIGDLLTTTSLHPRPTHGSVEVGLSLMFPCSFFFDSTGKILHWVEASLSFQ